MVIVYNCLSEFMVRRRMTASPPPSTVSTVLASKFGVKASKSWKKEILERAGHTKSTHREVRSRAGDKVKGGLSSTNSGPYTSLNSPEWTHTRALALSLSLSLIAPYLAVTQKKVQPWRTCVPGFMSKAFLIISDKIIFGKKSFSLH